MPYTIEWIVPKHIIKMKLFGEMERGEVQASYTDSLEVARTEGVMPVHTIVDASEIVTFDIKLYEINALIDTDASSLFGWTIIVTDSRFVRFLTTIFSKLTGGQFKTVDTYSEALAIIRKQAPELAQELPLQ